MTGFLAAQRAAARLRYEKGGGPRCFILMPPRSGDDWLDVFVRSGPEVLRQAKATAREVTLKTT